MPFLSGWAKYRTVTIDNANVSADILAYPLYLNISAAGGIGDVDLTSIFDELGANSLKIAVTTDDAVTECYVEVVSWDSVGETAELWVRVPTVSTAADTVLYLYYDATHADNTSYVGVVGSTPGKAVWDSNFVAVYHMNDTTTSTITGSTALNAAGVKKGANEPIEAVGTIGKAQTFDATDDTIGIGNDASLDLTTEITIEAIVKVPSNAAAWARVVAKEGAYYLFYSNEQNRIYFYYIAAGGDRGAQTTALTNGVAAYVAGTYKSGVHGHVWFNGAEVGTSEDKGDIFTNANNLIIGKTSGAGATAQTIDEARISNIARLPSYVHANDHNFRDDLVTFGAEQLSSTTYDETGRLQVILAVGGKTDYLVVTENRGMDILAMLGGNGCRHYYETGRLQTILTMLSATVLRHRPGLTGGSNRGVFVSNHGRGRPDEHSRPGYSGRRNR
jgi:hypothetical protein